MLCLATLDISEGSRLHAGRKESGERSGVSPPVPLLLYRQADACRSPILAHMITKRSSFCRQSECHRRLRPHSSFRIRRAWNHMRQSEQALERPRPERHACDNRTHCRCDGRESVRHAFKLKSATAWLRQCVVKVPGTVRVPAPPGHFDCIVPRRAPYELTYQFCTSSILSSTAMDRYSEHQKALSPHSEASPNHRILENTH
jgi:hypothetical protein